MLCHDDVMLFSRRFGYLNVTAGTLKVAVSKYCSKLHSQLCVVMGEFVEYFRGVPNTL